MPQEQIRVFPFFTFLHSVLLFPPTSPADLNSGSTKKSNLILKFCFHIRGVRKDVSEKDTGNLETMNRFRQCFLLPLQIAASLIKTKTRKKKMNPPLPLNFSPDNNTESCSNHDHCSLTYSAHSQILSSS